MGGLAPAKSPKLVKASRYTQPNSIMNKKKFVILACPRTGTNHYIGMLNSADGMHCHSEVFHKTSVFLRFGQHPELMEERDRDPIGFLRNLYDTTEGTAVGFKIFIDHNDAVVKHCVESDDIECIVLYRHNFLSAYSSNLIATENQQWVIMDGSKPKETKVEFKRKDFEFHHKRYQKYYRDIITRLNERSKKFMFIQYAETQSEPLVKQTFSFLGLPVPEKIVARATKINSTNILARFSNPEVVQATLEELNLQEWAYESFVSLD
jgi:hypothetical protein